MKNANKNYILYLVIFILILLLFYALITNKSAIVRKLQRDFSSKLTREGLTSSGGGLEWSAYFGYFNANGTPVLDFPTKYKSWTSGSGAIDLSSLNKITNNVIQENGPQHQYSIELKGYFRPNISGKWTFRTTSDNASYMWIGNKYTDMNPSNAIIRNVNEEGYISTYYGNNGTVSCDTFCAGGWTGNAGKCANVINNEYDTNGRQYKCSDTPVWLTGRLTNVACNCLKKEGMTTLREGLGGSKTVTSSPIDLIANTYYPIRIVMGESTNYYNLKVEWLPPGQNAQWSSDGTDLLFTSNIAQIEMNMTAKGLTWKLFDGYHNENVNYTNGRTYITQGIANNMSNLSTITGNQIIESHSFLTADGKPSSDGNVFSTGMVTSNPATTNTHNFTMEFFGYFKPTVSGVWEFFVTSDNGGFLWIDDAAKDSSNRSQQNALIYNNNLTTVRGSYNLQANQYYPIRILYGEATGGYLLRVGWKPPGGSWTCNGDGYFFNTPTGAVPEDKNDHSYYVYVNDPTKV